MSLFKLFIQSMFEPGRNEDYLALKDTRVFHVQTTEIADTCKDKDACMQYGTLITAILSFVHSQWSPK